METQQSERTTTRVVHFDIEGKFIADMARTRVEEGAWEHGLSLLTDSLHGMTHEVAVSLLKGEADLIGWSSEPKGIRVRKLKPTGPLARKMSERLDYLYGTTFHYNGTYWAPYAQVQGWNREDYEWAQAYPNYGHSLGFREHERKRLWVLRSLFYANAPATDLVVQVPHPSEKSPSIILCKPVQMPPLWMPVCRTDPVAFLAQAMAKGKRFAGRGASYEQQDAVSAEAASEALEDDEPEAASSVDSFLSRVDEKPSIAAVLKDIEERFTAIDDPAELAGLGKLSHELEAAARPVERKLPDAELDAVNALRDRLDARRLQVYGHLVREQADRVGGYMEVPLLDEHYQPLAPAQTLRVARNPFILWCLRHFDFEANGKERPEWSLVCPMGLKTMMDDPFHSDWMLGAGETFEDAYSQHPISRWAVVYRSANSLRSEITKEWTKAEFVVLAKGTRRWFNGEVVLPRPNEGVPPGSIAVVPMAGPQYQLAMETACSKGGVIICDAGGKLAHLAVVGREFGCTVLMMPGATKRFRAGQRLSVDMDEGTVHLNHV